MIEISSSYQSSKRLKFTPCHLPFDILINHVFVELPVSALGRCRCVCKQWLQALSEPKFARLHHKRQFQKPHNRKILCGPISFFKYPFFEKWEAFHGIFYILDLESSSDDVVAVRLPGFPLQQTGYYVSQTLGYSNGLVCMATRKYMDDSIYLLFGNPSTGVYKLLPEPIPDFLFGGFGYDSSTDDYKFVRVVDGMTHIFSLKSNSWRIIGYSPSEIVVNDTNIGCFLDGSIYWLLKSSNRILSFDLKDELFRDTSELLPPPVLASPIYISMMVVGGYVCIIHYNENEVAMWSLFNESETYSWKMSMSVTYQKPLDLDPLCFTEDGKILCFVDRGFDEFCYIVVDPKTKKIEYFTIPKIPDKFLKGYSFLPHLSGYIDTFVSPY